LRDVLFARPDELSNRAISKANREKRPAGATPPTLSCNCRLKGPVLLLAFGLAASILMLAFPSSPTSLHVRMARPHWGRNEIVLRYEADYSFRQVAAALRQSGAW